MLKFRSNTVTRTHEGHGTYIYNIKLSETLFIPIDVETFFTALSSGVENKSELTEVIVKDLDCSEEHAMLAVDNTLNSLQQIALIES